MAIVVVATAATTKCVFAAAKAGKLLIASKNSYRLKLIGGYRGQRL
jgi:hypothetical protein